MFSFMLTSSCASALLALPRMKAAARHAPRDRDANPCRVFMHKGACTTCHGEASLRDAQCEYGGIVKIARICLGVFLSLEGLSMGRLERTSFLMKRGNFRLIQVGDLSVSWILPGSATCLSPISLKCSNCFAIGVTEQQEVQCMR